MDQNQYKATDIQKYDLLSGKHNITECCRICMAQSTNMRNIFDVGSNLISKIEFCTGLKLLEQDVLPSQICDNCLSDLTVAHKFKTTCVLTDEALQNYLIQNVKVEVDDDDDYTCFNWVSDDDANDTKDVLEVKQEVVVKKEKAKSKPRIKLSVRKKKNQSHPLKKKILYCEPCDIKFKTRKAKEEHNRNLHKDQESYICEICGKVCRTRGTIDSHILSHFPPQFACDTCDYATQYKHDLAKHKRVHTGIKLFQCQYCTGFYRTSSNLISHIQRFHEKITRFSCSMCEKRFYDKTKLNRHLDSHNSVKRFECEVCHSLYTRRCYWKKHLQTQHNITIPAQRPGRQKVNIVIGESKIFDGK